MLFFLIITSIFSCAKPIHSTMVDLEGFIPNLKLDVRYATSNNFTKKIIYDSVRVFLVDSAAIALKNVAIDLEKLGLGILVFDAYRPLSIQRKLWEIYPDSNFVANPKKGSRHNRGAAIDLTLYQLSDGKSLEMPTEYDDFTEKASQNYFDLSETVLKNRNQLKQAMEKQGFIALDSEWWHFDYGNWKKYPVLDLDFKFIEKGL